MEDIISLFGSFDENIKKIESRYSVTITSHGSYIRIKGDPEDVNAASRAANGLLALISKGETVTDQNIEYVFSLVADG